MFPPHIRKSQLHPKFLRTQDTLDHAVYWFKDVYPYIVKNAKKLGMIECIQAPGETIFVPGDWWHAVFNIDMTVAITQNFCSKENFRRVFHRTLAERPRFGRRWQKVLGYTAPELALRAREWSSAENGSKWSTSSDAWETIDALTTLSTSDIGAYELVPKRRSRSGTNSGSQSGSS